VAKVWWKKKSAGDVRARSHTGGEGRFPDLVVALGLVGKSIRQLTLGGTG